MSSIILQVIGIVITIIFFFLIKILLRTRRSFVDFMVADDGRYSLARFQAFLWAFIIISFQTSVIFGMEFCNNGLYGIGEYSLTFPEQILFLLGLSFGSYIIVKGISVNEIVNNKTDDMIRVPGKWSDLITGSNGLDFSKFQMLIWTILAVVVYLMQCNVFLSKLNDPKLTAEEVREYFLTTEEKESYNKKYNKNIKTEEDMPSISWSFIVLMGLSQAVYIGKKIIPSFKVNEEREKILEGYKVRKIVLEEKIKLINEEINKLINDKSDLALKSKTELNIELKIYQSDLTKIDSEIAALEKSIEDVKNPQSNSPPTSGQTSPVPLTYSISGEVSFKDKEGKKIDVPAGIKPDDISVTLISTSDSNKFSKTVNPDKNWKYTILDAKLTEGTYNLSAETNDQTYESAVKSITLTKDKLKLTDQNIELIQKQSG